jgi:hypothetical protein
MMFLLGLFVVLGGVVTSLKVNGGGPAWGVRACGVLLVALGIQMCCQARRGLTVTDDGVDVQNTWRLHHVSWDEIRHFDVVWRVAYNSRWLRIELLDGSKLWSPGFHARNNGQREIVDGWVAELNRRASAATGLLPVG